MITGSAYTLIKNVCGKVFQEVNALQIIFHPKHLGRFLASTRRTRHTSGELLASQNSPACHPHAQNPAPALGVLAWARTPEGERSCLASLPDLLLKQFSHILSRLTYRRPTETTIRVFVKSRSVCCHATSSVNIAFCYQ